MGLSASTVEVIVWAINRQTLSWERTNGVRAGQTIFTYILLKLTFRQIRIYSSLVYTGRVLPVNSARRSSPCKYEVQYLMVI